MTTWLRRSSLCRPSNPSLHYGFASRQSAFAIRSAPSPFYSARTQQPHLFLLPQSTPLARHYARKSYRKKAKDANARSAATPNEDETDEGYTDDLLTTERELKGPLRNLANDEDEEETVEQIQARKQVVEKNIRLLEKRAQREKELQEMEERKAEAEAEARLEQDHNRDTEEEPTDEQFLKMEGSKRWPLGFFGRYLDRNGDLAYTEYEGEGTEEEVPEGKGKMKLRTGAEYEGLFMDGKLLHGTMTLTQGNLVLKYEGNWKDNLMHGHGQLRTPSGVYTGLWKRGEFMKGQLQFTEGTIFDGEFRHNAPCGYGSLQTNIGVSAEGWFSWVPRSSPLGGSNEKWFGSKRRELVINRQRALQIRTEKFWRSHERILANERNRVTALKEKIAQLEAESSTEESSKKIKKLQKRLKHTQELVAFENQLMNRKEEDQQAHETMLEQYAETHTELSDGTVLMDFARKWEEDINERNSQFPLVFRGEVGVLSGFGFFKHNDGMQYYGMLENFNPDGFGQFARPNGIQYAGLMHAGYMHGAGRIVYTNGDEFVGEFVGDLRHGSGRLIKKDGTLQPGMWILDEYTTKEQMQKERDDRKAEMRAELEAQREELKEMERSFEPTIDDKDDEVKWKGKQVASHTLSRDGRRQMMRPPAPRPKKHK